MDFVKILYTGRVKDGAVFDTTSEEVAKKEGVYDEKRIYHPMPVILGEKQVIDGLEDALKDMKVGEQKTVEIPPEKAFGQRDANLVRLISLKIFKKQNITPIPGMPVELDGRTARIQTVAGGRVRVDFNSDLAGKTVVYDIRLESKAESSEDKIKCLIERSFNKSDGFQIKLSGSELELIIPDEAYRDRNILARKASFSAEVFKYLELKSVKFTETWLNPKKKSSDEEGVGKDK